ncbi:MAG: phage tail tube protein [Acidimicrobiales bacterium]
MPFAIELQKWGFAKEAARGVAQAAPQKFLAVSNKVAMTYKTALIPDGKIRGIKEAFPSVGGANTGTGALTDFDVEADTIGDLLMGCLGQPISVQPDPVGSPLVFQHTFKPASLVQFPSFTLFADRGLDVLAYPLSVVKKLALTGKTDGKALGTADVLFKTEQPAAAFTQSFNPPKPLMFFQTQVLLDGVLNQDVDSWSLDADNGSMAIRTMNQSKDVYDIRSGGLFKIMGGYQIYFEIEANRQKFLQALPQALSISMTGDAIQNAYNHQLVLTIPHAQYTAYPFDAMNGLLGAKVAFEATRDPAAGYSLQAQLTNVVSGY